LAAGFARGCAARGKRMAFGDVERKRYVTSPWQEIIFQNNPNICWPKQAHHPDVIWHPFCKGNRLYNRPGPNRRWIWNYEFKAPVGEFYFASEELAFATQLAKGFILIEPHVPRHKSIVANKDWGFAKFQAVADRLIKEGYIVAQFAHHDYATLANVQVWKCPTIRHAAAAMRRASVIICPEGGTHHAAAAVGKSAVVIFGGFIPPQVIGYDFHINLSDGSEACGSLQRCEHCVQALKAISVDRVYEAVRRMLMVK
jgi:ADP-heptose:LPS heptosyltransferase